MAPAQNQLPRNADGLLIVDQLWENVYPMGERAYDSLSKDVIGFIVCVDPPVMLENMTASKNHWRLFLVFAADGNTVNAVSVDMVANSSSVGGRDGILGVVYRSYVVSKRAMAAFAYELPTGSSFTVKQFLDLLSGRGFLDYRYNERGTGCRFWVKTVVEYMISNNHIVPTTGTPTVEEYTKVIYKGTPDNLLKEPLAISPGEFV